MIVVYILFMGLLLWLALLQDKVNGLSKKIDNLSKGNLTQHWNNYEQNIIPEYTEHGPDTPTVPPTEPPAQEIYIEQTFEELQEEKEPQESFNIQKALLGNIFNKIGALAIIIALVIFIKLVSPYLVITPLMKVILAYLAGFGLIGGGLYLHKKENLKNYAEVMLGIGFADLFITTFCAYTLFGFFSTPGVIVLGTILLAATYILADKMKTLSMLIIGLIGAYLTPFCAKAGANAILSYMLFINMVSIIYTIRNKSTNWVNIVNLSLTMLIYLCYSFGRHQMSIVFPVILWGSYLIYDVLRDKKNGVDNAVSHINYAILTLFSLILFGKAHNALAILLGATAVIYLGYSQYSRRSDNNLYRFYEYAALVNIWLIVPLMLNAYQSAVAWSVLALLITVVIDKYNAQHLKGGLIWYYTTAFITSLSASFNGQNCLTAVYYPIFNVRTLLFAFPVLSMITSAFIMKKESPKTHNLLIFSSLTLGYIYLTGEINSILSTSGQDNFNREIINIIIGFAYAMNAKKLAKTNNSLLFNITGLIIFGISLLALIIWSYFYYDSYIVLLNMKVAAFAIAIASCWTFSRWDNTNIYKYIGIILGFLICHSESNQIYNQNPDMQYVISLSWVLYSGITTIIGILKNKKYLLNTGIALIILSILRIFIYDLANVEAIYKLIAFLTLGIILMLVSYIYTTHKNKQQ